MPKAYPIELRQRVVNAYEQGEGSYIELAERFCVGEATVNRWAARSRSGEGLVPRKPPGKLGQQLIDAAGLALIRDWLEDVPDLSMNELVVSYKDVLGIEVSRSTMSRAVNERLSFTQKKGPSGHRQRSGPTSSPSATPSVRRNQG